jgi:hypothetical protein
MSAHSQVLLVMLVSITGACGPSDRQGSDQDTVVAGSSTEAVERSRVVDTAAGAVTQEPTQAPTGSAKADPDVKGVEYWRDLDPKRTAAKDADHGFLRSMADHNEGIVHLLAFAKDRATGTTATGDVQRVTETHARIRTALIDMVRNTYQDVFTPVPVPGNKQRLDSLDLTKPETFNREFYQSTIQHNRLWLGRLDELSPRLKDPAVKAYATRLRAELQGEVDTFTRRLAGG